MAMIVICNRTTDKSSRLKVNDVNLHGFVLDLKQSVSKTINKSCENIELIYGGKCLTDGETLEHYGVKQGSTIHVLCKQHPPEETTPEPMTDVVIQQVVTALQTALINPAFRNTVRNMLGNPDTLESIVAATPGLSSDPVAVAMLQEPELLAIYADPSNIKKVIEAHPSLGQAAMYVATAVNEEGSTSAETRSRSARGTYSLDHMSDDEDDMPIRQRSSQPITATQLAAALAAASSAAMPPPQSAPPQGASSSGTSGSANSTISDNFFRQAMEDAHNAAIQSQLEQMRNMGITDEALARRALEATGGNLQAAIELIFGDGSFS